MINKETAIVPHTNILPDIPSRKKGNKELEYLKSLLYSLSVAESSNEINAIKDECREAGLIKREKKKQKCPSSRHLCFP